MFWTHVRGGLQNALVCVQSNRAGTPTAPISRAAFGLLMFTKRLSLTAHASICRYRKSLTIARRRKAMGDIKWTSRGDDLVGEAENPLQPDPIYGIVLQPHGKYEVRFLSEPFVICESLKAAKAAAEDHYTY